VRLDHLLSKEKKPWRHGVRKNSRKWLESNGCLILREQISQA
jgi:hypothetical protein